MYYTNIKREFYKIFVTLLILLLLVLAIPSVPVFYISRKIAQICAKTFRPKLGKMMSGVSALMSLDQIYTQPKANIVHYSTYSEQLDLQKMRKIYQQQVLHKIDPQSGKYIYPEFMQIPTTFLNYPFWKWDKHFDLNKHIRLYDYEGDLQLPSPCDENDLCRVMGGLLAQPWTEGQSPWEILLVRDYVSCQESELKTIWEEGKGQGRRESVSKGQGQFYGQPAKYCAQIFRFHHTLMDGCSISKIMLDDLSNANSEKSALKKITKNGKSLKNIVAKMLTIFIRPLRFPYDLADMVIGSVDEPSAWHLPGEEELSRTYYTSMTGPISVNLVKEIKDLHDVSYNSVLLAALTRGIERVMEQAGQKAPRILTVATTVPMPGYPKGLTNHTSVMFAKLPIISPRYGDETAKKRHQLLTTFNGMKKSKYYSGPAAMFYALAAISAVPNILRKFVYNKKNTTLLFSAFNIVEEPARIWGVNCTEFFFGSGLQSGKFGAAVTLLSWAGRQRFVVNIDQSVFPSQKIFSKLGRYIEDELQALHTAGLEIKSDC